MSYRLCVGAMFKNEEHIIVEWIHHYLRRGVDHFFLVSDESTDASIARIQHFVDEGIVTLYHSNWPQHLGRQCSIYTHFILPHLVETEWLLMVDLDEFMWSRLTVNLPTVLQLCPLDCVQIRVYQTIFGSNGHIHQPDGVVANFTRRRADRKTGTKYFVRRRSSHAVKILGVHNVIFADGVDTNTTIILDEPYLILNHYSCQSYDFWCNVKCIRGDGDNYLVRTPEDFHQYDINEIEDDELVRQNAAAPAPAK